MLPIQEYDLDETEGFFILTTKKSEPLTKNVPDILEWVTARLERRAESYYPYVLLIWYYYEQGYYNRALHWHHELMKIKDFKSKLNRSIPGQSLLKSLSEIKSIIEEKSQ